MRTLLTLTLLLGVAGAAQAQEHTHKHSNHAVGSVNFQVGCNPAAQQRMNTAVAMLHNFWLLEARKNFVAAAEADPACGVAYWGVALTHFGNPFAGGPGPEANKAGWEAAQKAATIGGSIARDQAYIAAAQELYRDHATVDNRTRMRNYAAALAKLHAADASDTETAVFNGLWLVATANPLDLTFAQQKKAADILNPLFVKYPHHPGLAHYIIHAFDSPSLARFAIDAAKRYAEIAPDAPHALHMPSHTFTRLGYWDESIKTNRRSADLESTPGAKAHASDYMVYAYLQRGQDEAALAVLKEIGLEPKGEDGTGATDGIGGYNALAMQARYALERDDWALASKLPMVANQPAFVQAVTRFARAIGSARSGNQAAARAEINELNKLVEALNAAKDPYWPIVVDAQRMAAEAWVAHLEGNHGGALDLARNAAEKEDLVEKHAVTPGPLIPARELLGDILMVHKQHDEALKAYEKTLEKEPNRARTILGAARAAKAAGKADLAKKYYSELTKLMTADSKRPALKEAHALLH